MVFDPSQRTLTVGIGPFAEEIAKGTFVALVVLWRHRVVDGILDGLIYAGLVGVGFAFTENVIYYSGAYSGTLDPALEGAGATAELFAIRGVLSPFAHPLFTSCIGLGAAIAVVSRRRSVQVFAPLLGLAAAVGVHAAWNGSAYVGGTQVFLVTYLGAMLPLLVLGICLAVWDRRREQTILDRSLQDAAWRGWLDPAEVHWLVGHGDRAAARRYASRVAGPDAAKALRAYQQAATDMAFMHDRVRHGRAPADGDTQVRAHLARMRSWRPMVVLPGVSRSDIRETSAASPADPARSVQWHPTSS